MKATVNQISKLQKQNPYGDAEMFETEMEGVRELSDIDQKQYLTELMELIQKYHWQAHIMPKGKFFGLAN